MKKSPLVIAPERIATSHPREMTSFNDKYLFFDDIERCFRLYQDVILTYSVITIQLIYPHSAQSR